MTNLDFTLVSGIRLIVRADDLGCKWTTIRLRSSKGHLKPGDAVCLRDARGPAPRVIGQATITTVRPLLMCDDGFRWSYQDMGAWPIPEGHLLPVARVDGFRGPDAVERMRRTLEAFYRHGKRMDWPIELVVLSWAEFRQDPDYAIPGEQEEMWG